MLNTTTFASFKSPSFLRKQSYLLSFSPQLQEDMQTIVLKVRMRCEICRTKALTIVAGTLGVISVRLEREQGKLVVEGERVEIDLLVKTLKKKVGYTEITHVSEF